MRALNPTRRRVLELAAAAPALITGGRAAAAAVAGKPTNYIEICLRDQFDFGHVFVAPGLATATDLKRGESGRQCALFYLPGELKALPGDVYLTPDSMALEPHVDSVAMVDLCELTDGPVHGHEACNPVRSPGRSRARAPGKMPTWEGEPGRNNSEGAFYSSTPTPVALHNYWQRQLSPGLRNGLAVKGHGRPFAMYHFGAGLPGAEPDRFQTVGSLMEAFPSGGRINALGSAAEADAVVRLLRRADPRYLARRGLAGKARADLDAQTAEVRGLLHGESTSTFTLALTPEERAWWSAGIRPKWGRTSIDLWEQAAYAFKLVQAGLTRSVAIEVDIGDVHGQRTRKQMVDQNVLVAVVLARLIESLQRAGIYDNTLVAVFTLDGGRSPAAASSGDEGKNGAILAGGMIRGGHYGDIRVAGPDKDGHKYAYHAPDADTGKPIADGALKNDKRLPAKHLWRTIAEALKIPNDLAGRFPDVADGKALPWLLRG